MDRLPRTIESGRVLSAIAAAMCLVESADAVYEALPEIVVVEAVGMWETRSVFQVAVGIA